MNLLVIGSLGYDYIMNFSGRFTDRIKEEKIHSLSLSFLVDSLERHQGGTAGNIAYSAKLLGITPYIFANAGHDFAPYKKFLRSYRIPTTYIKEYKDVPTSSYFVVTDTANNQIGSFYVGAMKYAAKRRLQEITAPIQFAIVAPTDPTAMQLATHELVERQIPFMYDPAFQIATLPKEELYYGVQHAQIVIGNDYEISLIEDALELTHDELVNKVPILVTTLGNKGSIIETAQQQIHIPIAKLKKVVDPTGAGDAYRAGFIAGYLRGLPLPICGQIGSVTAVYTVELSGTQTHQFTKREFTNRYRSNFPDTIVL